MNANIMMTQILHKMKYDLRGHQRSQKVILIFKIILFYDNLFKTFQECQHYEDLKGHPGS